MATINLTSTAATQILNENPKRTRLRIQMLPFDVDAGNTGRIHVGFGFQPIAVVGHVAQGEVLLQGAAIDEPPVSGKLSPDRKRIIWATSSQNNQSINVEEETDNG